MWDNAVLIECWRFMIILGKEVPLKSGVFFYEEGAPIIRIVSGNGCPYNQKFVM